MHVIDLPLDQLKEAHWNPNQMDPAMLGRLKQSIFKYSLVENLVVRPLDQDTYEVLSGNQRLKLLRESGCTHAPCVVVSLDDAEARLLSQALNRIQGEDDLGLRSELLRQALAAIPQEQVLALLPETPQSLAAATSLSQQTLDQYLQAWQEARGARLHHYTFQLTSAQIDVVEEAISRVLPQARQSKGDSPSDRGTALYLLCESYLKKEGQR